jgi:hypothetical protein
MPGNMSITGNLFVCGGYIDNVNLTHFLSNFSSGYTSHSNNLTTAYNYYTSVAANTSAIYATYSNNITVGATSVGANLTSLDTYHDSLVANLTTHYAEYTAHIGNYTSLYNNFNNHLGNYSTLYTEENSLEANFSNLVANYSVHTHSGLSIWGNITTATTSCNISNNDCFLVDATGGAITVTLQPITVPLHVLNVKKVDATNVVKIQVKNTATQTIDGDPNLTIPAASQWTSYTLITGDNLSTWYII